MFGRRRKAVITETAPIYRFLGTEQPSAGAMRYAFVSRQGLPPSNAFGPGRQNGWTYVPMRLFSPQIWQQHGTTMQGYGGIVAGQIFTQQLISQG